MPSYMQSTFHEKPCPFEKKNPVENGPCHTVCTMYDVCVLENLIGTLLQRGRPCNAVTTVSSVNGKINHV